MRARREVTTCNAWSDGRVLAGRAGTGGDRVVGAPGQFAYLRDRLWGRCGACLLYCYYDRRKRIRRYARLERVSSS